MVFDLLNFDPSDLKNLSYSELESLSAQIREFLINSVSQTGGHLASNLGIVELTLALHRVFDSPNDKLIWDVGHQSYVHKIITNRGKYFDTLRQYGGISGFPRRSESEHDAFDVGHSSTSVSAGIGIATAAKLLDKDINVISVIGDGAMTGGMVFEALNQVGSAGVPMIIVLNDNDMSISKNVGAFKNYLTSIRSSKSYIFTKRKIKKDSPKTARVLEKIKNSFKQFFVEPNLFEDMGIKYLGPIDGHNIKVMEKVLSNARDVKIPVLVHVVTKKGKGYKKAEENPTKYHGINSEKTLANSEENIAKINNSECFARELCDIARENKNVVAISAAMPEGTKLSLFAKEFPDRFFDVGIAEQHAVTFAAGLATQGLKPVFAVYSTFLQRAYDQVLHDVCLQNLPVIFAVDRAGMVGEDGETHHGVYDIAYLNSMPNMTVLSPSSQNELRYALRAAMDFDGPIAIRYPRKKLPVGENISDFKIGKWSGEVTENVIITSGYMYDIAKKVIKKLEINNKNYTLINASTLKPLDTDYLDKICKTSKKVVCIEDGIVESGFCSSVSMYLHENNKFSGNLLCVGIPNKPQPHGNVDLLYEAIKMDEGGIYKRIMEFEETN